jgi:hypothetical protein
VLKKCGHRLFKCVKRKVYEYSSKLFLKEVMSWAVLLKNAEKK